MVGNCRDSDNMGNLGNCRQMGGGEGPGYDGVLAESVML